MLNMSLVRHSVTQTNPAVEQNKNIKWYESPWNQSGRKRKGLWRKGFTEEPSLEFRIKY